MEFAVVLLVLSSMTVICMPRPQFSLHPLSLCDCFSVFCTCGSNAHALMERFVFDSFSSRRCPRQQQTMARLLQREWYECVLQRVSYVLRSVFFILLSL